MASKDLPRQDARGGQKTSLQAALGNTGEERPRPQTVEIYRHSLRSVVQRLPQNVPR
jgi:hypothetical protein